MKDLTKEQYELIIKHLQAGKLTDVKIAKLAHCNNGTISAINHGKCDKVKWMYDGSFPIRKGKVEPYTDQEVIGYYLKTQSIEETLRHFRISRGTMGRIMRRNGFYSQDKVWYENK